MKSVMKVSVVSLVCALCTVGISSVHAASSVRTFGGSGTYNSGSSAAAARVGSNNINSVRAGSIRATGGSARPTSVASNASAGSARTASANARLSVGSYLQGGKSISGGSSIKSQNPASGGGSVGSGNAAVQDQVDKLEVRVDDLESNVIDLKDDVNNNVKKDIVDLQKGVNDLQTDLDNKVQSLEGSKQDVLQAGVGIIIDTNTNTISASGVATSTDVEELERKVNKNITDIAAVEQSVLSQDVNVGKIITALVGATATADELAALGPLGSLARKSSVDTADIANLAVTTDKLDAGAVTKTKLEVDIQNKLQVLPSSAPSTALGKDYVMVVNDQAGVGQWVEVAYPPTSP